MSGALTFFSELSDEKNMRQYAKMFSALMCEMRKMPESAYSDPKVMKTTIEYLEHCSNSMRTDQSQKNVRARMANRLVKLAQIRKAKNMAAKLETDDTKAENKEDDKTDAGEGAKTKDEDGTTTTTTTTTEAKEDAATATEQKGEGESSDPPAAAAPTVAPSLFSK